MITRTITLTCTYKVKRKDKQLDFNDICTRLKSNLANKINTEEFDSALYAITKEFSINIERIEEPEVEFIITIFITTYNAPLLPRKLFKQYMENNLLKIEQDDFTARIIKRRIY